MPTILKARSFYSLSNIEQGVNYALLLIIVFLYYQLGFQFIFDFVFCWLIYILIKKKFESQHLKTYRSRFDFFLFYVSIALALCLIYRSFYGSHFGWAADDSFYIDKINDLIQNGANKTNNYTLFEFLIYLIYGVILNKDSIDLLNVLPIASMFSSLLIYRLIALIHELIPNKRHWIAPSLFSFPILILALNPKFINISCHFYRDSATLYFQLWSMWFAVKNRHFFSIFFALLTGLLRGGNGLLALCFLIVIYLSKRIKVRNTLVARFCLIALVMISLIGFLYIDSIYKFGTYSRSFYGWNTDRMTVVERALLRSDLIDSSRAKYGPILAYPAFMFSPFVFDGFFVKREVHYEGRSVGQTYMINEIFIFEIFIILIWPFVIPNIIFGAKNCLIGDDNRLLSILIYSLISIMLVVNLSAQHRHSVSFIIFYPLFYLVTSKTRQPPLLWMQIVLATILIILNIRALVT